MEKKLKAIIKEQNEKITKLQNDLNQVRQKNKIFKDKLKRARL